MGLFDGGDEFLHSAGCSLFEDACLSNKRVRVGAGQDQPLGNASAILGQIFELPMEGQDGVRQLHLDDGLATGSTSPDDGMPGLAG